jgi:hypothetical protein
MTMIGIPILTSYTAHHLTTVIVTTMMTIPQVEVSAVVILVAEARQAISNMWTAFIILAIVSGIILYDKLPLILAHREKMAQLKKNNDK